MWLYYYSSERITSFYPFTYAICEYPCVSFHSIQNPSPEASTSSCVPFVLSKLLAPACCMHFHKYAYYKVNMVNRLKLSFFMKKFVKKVHKTLEKNA